MKEFELLKRTYPVSECKRICDGWLYIADNTTPEERKELKINLRELPRHINKDEKYIYQVAKESGVFKIMCICFENYEIIRKKMFKLADD